MQVIDKGNIVTLIDKSAPADVKTIVDYVLYKSFDVTTTQFERTLADTRDSIKDTDAYTNSIGFVVNTLNQLQSYISTGQSYTDLAKQIVNQALKSTVPRLSSLLVDLLEEQLKAAGLDPDTFEAFLRILFPEQEDELMAAFTYFTTKPYTTIDYYKASTFTYYNEAVYNFKNAPRMTDSYVLSMYLTLSDLTDVESTIKFIDKFLLKYNGSPNSLLYGLVPPELNPTKLLSQYRDKLKKFWEEIKETSEFSISDCYITEHGDGEATLRIMDVLSGDSPLASSTVTVEMTSDPKRLFTPDPDFYLKLRLMREDETNVTSIYLKDNQIVVYPSFSVKKSIILKDQVKGAITADDLEKDLKGGKVTLYVDLYKKITDTKTVVVSSMQVPVNRFTPSEKWYKLSLSQSFNMDYLTSLRDFLSKLMLELFGLSDTAFELVNDAINSIINLLESVVELIEDLINFIILVIKILKQFQISYISFIGSYTDLPDAWYQVKRYTDVVDVYPTFIANLVLSGPQEIAYMKKVQQAAKELKKASVPSVSQEIEQGELVTDTSDAAFNIPTVDYIQTAAPAPVTAQTTQAQDATISYNVYVQEYTGVV